MFLVDDRSTDQTANFAEGVAHAVGKPQQLHIISGVSLPNGWSGKLWAVEQGINSASKAFSLPAIAFLYTLMTLDSALRHWQGRGGAWKGRVYPDPDNL